MSKTLLDIVEETKDGERVDYEDLRWAVIALSALLHFDSRAISDLRRAEEKKKKPLLISSAVWQHEECFKRHKNAMSRPPKEWVGPENDPDNPEYQKQRKTAFKVMDHVMKRVQAKEK